MLVGRPRVKTTRGWSMFGMPQAHHQRVGVSLKKRTVGLVLKSLPLPHQSNRPHLCSPPA
jgi:hypothetical protein